MTSSISLKNFAWWRTQESEIAEKQSILDVISEKLSKEDIENLENILSWVASEAADEREADLVSGEDL